MIMLLSKLFLPWLKFITRDTFIILMSGSGVLHRIMISFYFSAMMFLILHIATVSWSATCPLSLLFAGLGVVQGLFLTLDTIFALSFKFIFG